MTSGTTCDTVLVFQPTEMFIILGIVLQMTIWTVPHNSGLLLLEIDVQLYIFELEYNKQTYRQQDNVNHSQQQQIHLNLSKLPAEECEFIL